MSSFPGSVLLTGDAVLKISSTKQMPLGTRGYTRDGRVFRYARAGATALKPGLIVQSSAPLAGAIGLNSGTTELRANSSKITVISGSSGVFTTLNAYADGFAFLYTSSTAKGAGYYAQIKSQSTQTATATGKVVLNFVDGDAIYSGTTNAGTTAAKIGLIRNPYDKVIVVPAGGVTAPVVGVPPRPVTASYYFWLQTWGYAPVRCDTVANKIGTPVGASTGTTAGRVQGIISTKATSGASVASWTQVNQIIAQVGVQALVGVSGEYRVVLLKLAP